MQPSRIAFLRELMKFLKTQKRWVFAPLIVLMILLGLFVAVAQSSSVAPLLYTIF